MVAELPLRVIDAEGVGGVIEAERDEPPRLVLRLDDGRRVELPREVLSAGHRAVRLPIALASLDGAPPPSQDEVTIPLAEERLRAGKRRVVTGVVRVEKKVEEREQVIDEPVRLEEVEVSRVPVDRYVEEAAAVREEDGVLVIPVHEEVLVLERRLLLKEEVRVKRTAREERQRQAVVLREERVDVSRRPGADGEGPSDHTEPTAR